MVDLGIGDGDLAIIHKQTTANNGDVVVALVDDEATLKRLFIHDGEVELRPANKLMKSVFLDHGDLRIQGVMVMICRKP
jgi:repressor LexA